MYDCSTRAELGHNNAQLTTANVSIIVEAMY